MKPQFSFNYGDTRRVFCASKSETYQLEDKITVRVEVVEHKEYDAIEWVVFFENASDKNSLVFSDIWDCETLLPLTHKEPPKAGYMPTNGNTCVITMTGMVKGDYYWENDKVSATEYSLNYEYLDKAANKCKKFSNVFGRSSEGMMPFFDVTASGNGYIAAVGWSGDWKTEFAKKEDGVVMKSGLKETRFYLEPKESVRTSSVLVMKYTKEEDKYNKFRRLIKNHFSHKNFSKTERDGLMAIEFWGGLTSEEIKRRVSELKKHDIRFEDVWLDAGWYGNCTNCQDAFTGDWSNCTGDWEVNLNSHPSGLVDVSDSVKSMGAKLMLWFEPERAILGTKIIEKHPDWFLSIPNIPVKILNYGIEDARRYVSNLLSDYVKKLDLSCYRQDFNAYLSEFFELGDKENRRGITEIKHIMGMYKIWDELLEEFPYLIIDNCASGGRRIDVETLKRSIPFFRTDYLCNFNENPEVLQAHNSNVSLYLPYNGCSSKTKDDVYAIRSSYSSSWGVASYSAIFQSMDENDFKWLKKYTEEYRRIRKYMSKDFYNLASSGFDETSWTVWQYHDSEKQSGVVIAFRRSKSPFDRVNINLKGLISGKIYTALNLDDGTTKDIDNSLEIVLPNMRSSVIFEYFIK